MFHANYNQNLTCKNNVEDLCLEVIVHTFKVHTSDAQLAIFDKFADAANHQASATTRDI